MQSTGPSTKAIMGLSPAHQSFLYFKQQRKTDHLLGATRKEYTGNRLPVIGSDRKRWIGICNIANRRLIY